MAKMNLFVAINAFSDAVSTNNPALNLFKWARELNAFPVQDDASGKGLVLAPGESQTLYNGTVSLGQDGTTVYGLALKIGKASTYVLQYVSGSAPNFRSDRPLAGLDNTSLADISQNGPVSTLTISAGSTTNFATDGIVAGDRIRLGPAFLVDNQGEFKVLFADSTSVQFLNDGGVAQVGAILGATPKDNLRAYSAAGVQAGNTMIIFGGFSPASLGSYLITDVTDDYLEFSSTKALPEQDSVNTDEITIYTAAKNLVYIESNKKVLLSLNGSAVNVEPFVDPAGKTTPGLLLNKSTVYSLTVTNVSEDIATLYFASAE